MSLYGQRELASSFRGVRDHTIRIAEDIPEESYSYRPTPEVRSVGEALLHMAGSTIAAQRMHGGDGRMTSFEGFDFRGLFGSLPIQERDARSKSEILALLREEGERFARWIGELPEPLLAEQVRMQPGANPSSKSRFELLLGMKEHEMHHRAQLMVMERLLGIVPHLSRPRP